MSILSLAARGRFSTISRHLLAAISSSLPLTAPCDRAPRTRRTSLMRNKSLFWIAGCAAALAVGGCARPWANSLSTAADPPHTSAVAAQDAPATGLPPLANAEHGRATPPDLPLDPTVAAPDLAGVLDKLQQVREIDPAAEPRLLEELRRTPPNSWPLVAEQFRASLAYREQLAAASVVASGGQDELSAERFASLDFRPTGGLPPQRNFDPAGAPSESLALPNSMRAEYPSSEPIYPIGANPVAAAVPVTSPIPASPPGASIGAVPSGVQTSLSAPAQQLAGNHVSIQPGSEDLDRTLRSVDDEDWQLLLEKAADDLSRRVAPSPTTTAEVHQHVSLRILRLLTGDTERALEPIPRISPIEQDYWSRQLFALATYLDHHGQPDDKRRAAASVTHLDEAVSHLRELGSLSVRNLAFCKTVYGYGAIEPYDGDRFSPGQQVSLYIEVENYHSQSTEKGYCTSLGSTYEILTEAGERVGGGEIPDVNDCCRTRRRDFHIQYGLALPEKLAPGRYQLQLVIKDRKSDKRGHATAWFEIKGAGL